MTLTTLSLCRQVPTMVNVVKTTDTWLQTLIDSASLTIKKWCKQGLELESRTEYYSGNEQPDIVLRQYPVWVGFAQVAAGSNGVALPTATINVTTTLAPDGTSAFDPGGRSSGQSPTIAVQTSLTTWTVVSYTGLTATTFTGCSGGTGTLSSSPGLCGVNQPVVWFDPSAYWGQAPPGTSPYAGGIGPFAPGTIQVNGVNCSVVADQDANKSFRGLLRRVGGFQSAGGWIGSYPSGGFGGRGKLAAYQLPTWPRGYGNIKVQYSAGYEDVPTDIQYCTTTLVAGMVRNQPSGIELSSEGLGSYSYSILQGSQDPDIGNVRRILSRYCEMAW